MQLENACDKSWNGTRLWANVERLRRRAKQHVDWNRATCNVDGLPDSGNGGKEVEYAIFPGGRMHGCKPRTTNAGEGWLGCARGKYSSYRGINRIATVGKDLGTGIGR
jgi:hypothetical protein